MPITQAPVRANRAILIDPLREPKGIVIITSPEDEDRFEMTVGDAARACKQWEATKEFRAKFDIMLRRIGRWIYEHRDSVKRGIVTVRDRGLMLIVMVPFAEMNPEFEVELSNLDVGIANDADLDDIQLSVMSMPEVTEECLQSFLSGRCLEYRLAEN